MPSELVLPELRLRADPRLSQAPLTMDSEILAKTGPRIWTAGSQYDVWLVREVRVSAHEAPTWVAEARARGTIGLQDQQLALFFTEATGRESARDKNRPLDHKRLERLFEPRLLPNSDAACPTHSAAVGEARNGGRCTYLGAWCATESGPCGHLLEIERFWVIGGIDPALHDDTRAHNDWAVGRQVRRVVLDSLSGAALREEVVLVERVRKGSLATETTERWRLQLRFVP